jgi:hypothetical protein
VAVSADGKTAIIGAPGDNNGVGATWVYTRSGSTWTQQAKLVGTGYIWYICTGHIGICEVLMAI